MSKPDDGAADEAVPTAVDVRPGERIVDAQGHRWSVQAARDELLPAFRYLPPRNGEPEQWQIVMDGSPGRQGWWQSQRRVEGGKTYRFRVKLQTSGMVSPRRSAFPKLVWLDHTGHPARHDGNALGPYHPPGAPVEATPQWPLEQGVDKSGALWFGGMYRAPANAEWVRIEFHAQWAPGGETSWSELSWEACPAPPQRKVRLAAVHYCPSGKSPEENRREFAPLIAEAARQNAQLVVLPEVLTYYGTGRSFAECAEPVPGPSTEFFGALARHHRLHLVAGLLERDGPLVYNVAVLIGDDGQLIGKYRKVCLPRAEVEGGITPGDSYPVFDTPIGRIGMMVCYDGFFPEVARRLSESGAEIIAFPVWGCNPLLAAARACENHVYVVSSTYSDISRNWMITGVFGHDGTVLTRAERFGSVVVAEVDLTWPTFWAGLGDFRAEVQRHRPLSAREYWQAAQRLGGSAAPDRQSVEPRWTPVAEQPVRAQEAEGGEQSVPEKTTMSSNQENTRPTGEINSLRLAPLEPAEAVKTFHTKDGFQMQLVAAEPLVADPVAMEFDEFGRAYVLEMRDYPYTDKSTDVPFQERQSDEPLGRVRLLVDRDEDGVFDTSTVFADGLSWPTGLALWQGGIFVAATPDIWYLKDTDGDGKADIRRRVFHGFRKFNVQAVINNLKWGLDHRIYGAGSSNGGRIVANSAPDRPPVIMGTHDFRFDPITEHFELLSGGGRFGQAFDDWGNRFICNIRNPIRHVVFPEEAMRRNPRVRFPGAVVDVAEAGDTIPVYRSSRPEPWRVLNAERLAADRTLGSPRSETVAAGYMTSACGLTLYRGSAYPPHYYGQAFLGEVAGNLIHRQQMVPHGVTFRSYRIDERSEFVTSTDNWFRPVNFVNAPDGTLYVLDMYRETIEHPWSIPEDIKAHLDLECGRDRGRIYRLAPPGFHYSPIAWPGMATGDELVRLLGHPNGWHRDTAFRLLYERQDPSTVPALRTWLDGRLTAGEPRLTAMAAVLALWSLQGLSSLTDEDLQVAAAHVDSHVREHAFWLASVRPVSEALIPHIRRGVGDENARVRFAACLAAGRLPDVHRLDILEAAVWHTAADPWLEAAVMSSAVNLERRLLEKILRSSRLAEVSEELLGCVASIVERLAEVVGVTASADELGGLLAELPEPSQPGPGDLTEHWLVGFVTGIDRRGWRLEELLGEERVQRRWSAWLEAACIRAADGRLPVVRRVAALRIAAQSNWARLRDVVEPLLSAVQPPELQQAAVQATLRWKTGDPLQTLLSRYRQLSPQVRAEALAMLVARPTLLPHLLDAIEQGLVSAAELSPTQCAIIMRHPDMQLRDRAKRLLTFSHEERAVVVERYRQALKNASLDADPARGQSVFGRVCANCHRLATLGTDVGPPLETVLHRSPAELLLHILDPNREVLPNYQEYVLVLRDGRSLTGMIAQETPTAVTLRRAGGQVETVGREDIEQIIATGKSLMPEGLERDITVEEMRHLLAFLAQAASIPP